MVTYDKNEKDLVIPSALGLAGMQDSVCGVTEQEVIEIVESAITDYDTEIQVDLEDIRENVSGNTNDIAALSAATEALEQRVDDISTSALTEQIEALSGSVGDIRSDVNTLSGDTDSIRTDVAALSAQTSANTATIVAGFNLLKGEVGALNAQTSANTENIATLSGATVGIEGNLNALSGRTSAITEQVTELSGVTSGLSADVAALSGVTEGIATSVGGLSTGLEALSAATSGLSADMAALEANDNIAFFNLIKDYGNSNEELARLYDDMDAANTAGKTVVVMSNFATGDTLNASVFATFRKDLNGGFYGAGTGIYYDGATYVAARVVPIFQRGDYYNVISKNGHFYFKPMGTISPYTLPTSSNSTKGGIKTGSGVTMSGDFLSVKYGDGLGMSGDTLVVSGGTGGGDYLVVDALSAVTSPEEGQMAQVRTQVSEMQYIRFYVADSATYPEEGYWGAIKYGGETRAIYNAGSDFHWDYGDGNANSGWFPGELYGYTYVYRCMKPDRDGVDYPEFHISLPENSPLTVGIWDEGGGEQPQGIATAVTAETVYNYSVPAVYTNGVWTPLSKVFTKNDFPDSASTAQAIQEVRAMVTRGIYPEVHWNNGTLFYESDAGIWITFKNMFDNTNYRLYISDTVFDDNGFDSRGIRFDEDGISFPGTMCLYVDPSGDMEHRDASCLFDESSQFQLAVKGCELDFSVEYGFGSVVYARKYNISDDYWYYTWSLIVPTDTDVKKGVWHCDESNGGSMGDISTYVLDSWTTLS